MKNTRVEKLLISSLFIITLMAHAGDFPPEGFTKTRSEQSPEGTFRVDYFRKGPDEVPNESQIWLEALDPGSLTQHLFDYSDDATCRISRDENFIAIDNHVLDGLDDVDVFVRDKDGVYRETKRNMLQTSLRLMVKQLKLRAVPQFDFKHCMTDAWLRDGLLLCHLAAHESTVSKLNEWYFIYDVKNDRFTWDLSRINEGTFHFVHHDNEH